MDHILGTVWWTGLAFVAGALIGPSMWRWLTAKMPWSR